MKKRFNIYVSFAIASYAIRTVVDIVMYFYTIFNKSNEYYDNWYLIMPHIVSVVFLCLFYNIFFSDKFYGLFIKISTAVVMFFNIAFVLFLFYDKQKGYVFYFTLVAAINFLNALHIKCNIVPIRKPGAIEYGPLLFETISFLVMAISMYSLFCGFPLTYNNILKMWSYYDVLISLEFNAITSAIITVEFLLCRRNDSEYIRDNMIDESYFIQAMRENALNEETKGR